MSKGTHDQLDDYVLGQHAAAISQKLLGSEHYKRSRWRRIGTNAMNVQNSLSDKLRFWQRMEYASLKLPLERWHLAMWGYPADVSVIFTAGDSIFGIYEDLVLGNYWRFIVADTQVSICAELPMKMGKINFFQNRLTEDEEEGVEQMRVLQAIKNQAEKATG